MILYHAPSSYYSMIARLALLEAGLAFDQQMMDIHFAQQQNASWYVAINPNMTVPCLAGEGIHLTDSRDILQFAAQSAGATWMDGEPSAAALIAATVEGHYRMSIESLTFTRLMNRIWPLRVLFPRALARINRKLQAGLSSASDPEAVRGKIALKTERMAYFTQGDLRQKLQVQRDRVVAYLRTLPAPQPFLFGERMSSADVVVAVLLGRLRMIGEEALFADLAGLGLWFEMMQSRDAFARADIWVRFQPLRIFLRR
jgi:tetrachloro-p-hydroquinone reductive dehalogenase